MEGMSPDPEETAVQAERTRIARAIHDGVSQKLALLMLKMEIISRLADENPPRMKLELAGAIEILEASVRDLREAVHSLRSPDVGRVGLPVAIRQLARGFSEQTGAAIELSLPGDCPAPSELQSAVFGAIQRRLEFIRTDGLAGTVWLTLAQTEGQLVATVRDDGCTPAKGQQLDELWLAETREQLARAGCELRSRRTPSATTIEIVAPL